MTGRHGKRQSVCSIVFSLASVFIVCTTATAGSLALKTETIPIGHVEEYPGRLWSNIGPTLDTPEIISKYLNRKLRYKQEPEGVCNYTQSPEETLELKTGDCEDFAYIVVDALRNHGYETRFLTVEALTRAGTLNIHALGIYRDKETGKWHYIQKDRFLGLEKGVSGRGYDDTDEMAADIAARMNGVLHRRFILETPQEYIELYDKDTYLIN